MMKDSMNEMSYSDLRRKYIDDMPYVKLGVNVVVERSREDLKSCKIGETQWGTLRINRAEYIYVAIERLEDNYGILYWMQYEFNGRNVLVSRLSSDEREDEMSVLIYTANFFEQFIEFFDLEHLPFKEVCFQLLSNKGNEPLMWRSGDYLDDNQSVLKVAAETELGWMTGWDNLSDKFLVLDKFIGINRNSLRRGEVA